MTKILKKQIFIHGQRVKIMYMNQILSLFPSLDVARGWSEDMEKYTGRTIDDIPERFVDGQTLEIRQLIRFIQNSTIIENNCEIHTNFTGKL